MTTTTTSGGTVSKSEAEAASEPFWADWSVEERRWFAAVVTAQVSIRHPDELLVRMNKHIRANCDQPYKLFAGSVVAQRRVRQFLRDVCRFSIHVF
jgi:hypothetical protein